MTSYQSIEDAANRKNLRVLIALRGISDGATELRHVGDWTEYLHVIDERLAGAVGLMEQALGDGTIRL